MEKCDFKADILKQEIDLLARKIDHFDDLRHRTKQMAATLWLAAVGTALTLPSKPLLWLALFIPTPFWYYDAQYNAYQAGFWQRWWAIRQFIRDGTFKVPAGLARLDDLFSNCSQCVFPVPDFYGNKTFDEADLKKKTSLIRNAFTKKMLLFYGAFAVAAVVLIVLFSRLNLGALRSK
jgi:hypothetical protein